MLLKEICQKCYKLLDVPWTSSSDDNWGKGTVHCPYAAPVWFGGFTEWQYLDISDDPPKTCVRRFAHMSAENKHG